MQVVIPMSGFGERFRRAGFNIPKPLIPVENRPIIEHVIRNFPPDSDFVFICNADHLDEPAFRMEETLRRIAPRGRIVAVAPHKLGPVHAVLSAKDQIRIDGPTIVNYCDFGWLWDWEDFSRRATSKGVAGVIVTYTGFHPHMRTSTNYAYVRTEQVFVTDIQEKKSFTADPMRENASSGTYFFASGGLMLEAFEHQVLTNLSTNGEFYVSLAYRYLLDHGMPVVNYSIAHFMQWGTPEDLSEYLAWSAKFRSLHHSSPADANLPGDVVLPMAGRGSRFLQAGWDTPKPFIEVSARPMAAHAVGIAHRGAGVVIVTRSEHAGLVTGLRDELAPEVGWLSVLEVDRVTEGQAATSLLGIKALSRVLEDRNVSESDDRPVTVVPSDAAVVVAPNRVRGLLDADDWDLIVWTSDDTVDALRNPEQYGWVEHSAEGMLIDVHVKKRPESPSTCSVVIGCFTFRSRKVGIQIIESLLSEGERINGEFYLDTAAVVALRLGLRVKSLPVDHFFCWGTPDELLAFQYWQRCFDLWDDHPYSIDSDRMIPAGRGYAALPAASELRAASVPVDRCAPGEG